MALISEPIFTLAVAIPFGAWQVISGIIFAIKLNLLSKNNKLFVTIYPIITAMTLTLIFIVYRNQMTLTDHQEETAIGIIATFSGVLAIAFFIFSIKMLKNVLADNSDTLTDILD